jgi:hypothetical protein
LKALLSAFILSQLQLLAHPLCRMHPSAIFAIFIGVYLLGSWLHLSDQNFRAHFAFHSSSRPLQNQLLLNETAVIRNDFGFGGQQSHVPDTNPTSAAAPNPNSRNQAEVVLLHHELDRVRQQLLNAQEQIRDLQTTIDNQNRLSLNGTHDSDSDIEAELLARLDRAAVAAMGGERQQEEVGGDVKRSKCFMTMFAEVGRKNELWALRALAQSISRAGSNIPLLVMHSRLTITHESSF